MFKKGSFFIGDQKSDKICAKKNKIYFENVQKDIFKQVKRLVEKN